MADDPKLARNQVRATIAAGLIRTDGYNISGVNMTSEQSVKSYTDKLTEAINAVEAAVENV